MFHLILVSDKAAGDLMHRPTSMWPAVVEEDEDKETITSV